MTIEWEPTVGELVRDKENEIVLRVFDIFGDYRVWVGHTNVELSWNMQDIEPASWVDAKKYRPNNLGLIVVGKYVDWKGLVVPEMEMYNYGNGMHPSWVDIVDFVGFTHWRVLPPIPKK